MEIQATSQCPRAKSRCPSSILPLHPFIAKVRLTFVLSTLTHPCSCRVLVNLDILLFLCVLALSVQAIPYWFRRLSLRQFPYQIHASFGIFPSNENTSLFPHWKLTVCMLKSLTNSQCLSFLGSCENSQILPWGVDYGKNTVLDCKQNVTISRHKTRFLFSTTHPTTLFSIDAEQACFARIFRSL